MSGFQIKKWKAAFFQPYGRGARKRLCAGFAVVVLLLTILYGVSNSMIRRELLEDNLLKSKVVEKNLYIAFEQLNNILKSGEQLVSENNAVLEQNFSEIPVETLIQLIDEIDSLKVYNPFIQEMVLFREGEPNYITSQGIISGDNFFHYDYNNPGYDREFFENIFYDYNAPTVLPLREYRQAFNYDGEGVLRIFIVPKIYKVFHTGILLLINEQKFIEFCAITDEQLHMRVSLYNDEGSIVISNNINEIGTRLDTGKLKNNPQSVESGFWGRFRHVKWFDYENMIYSVENFDYTGIVLFVFYLFLLALAGMCFFFLRRKLVLGEGYMEQAAAAMGSREPLSLKALPEQIVRLKKNIALMNGNTAVLKRTALANLLKRTDDTEENRAYLEDNLKAECFGIFCAVMKEDKMPEKGMEDFFARKKFLAVVFPEGGHRYTGLVPFEYAGDEKDAAAKFSELMEELQKTTGGIFLYSSVFQNFNLAGSVYIQLVSSLDQLRVDDTVCRVDQLRPSYTYSLPGNLSGELNKLLAAGNQKSVKRYFEEFLQAALAENPSYYELFCLIQHFGSVFMELTGKTVRDNGEIKGIFQLFLQSFKRYSAELDVDGVLNSFYNMVYLVMEKLQSESNAKDIREIIKYINKNFREEMYLEKAATHFGMKPKYFSYYFKREYGMGFNEYLTQLRIEEAKRLLKESDLTVSEISQQIGYQNQVTFNAAFKKYTGISPTSFRKEA